MSHNCIKVHHFWMAKADKPIGVSPLSLEAVVDQVVEGVEIVGTFPAMILNGIGGDSRTH